MMSRGTKLTMIMTGKIFQRILKLNSSLMLQSKSLKKFWEKKLPTTTQTICICFSLNLSESSSVTTVREQPPQATTASLQVTLYNRYNLNPIWMDIQLFFHLCSLLNSPQWIQAPPPQCWGPRPRPLERSQTARSWSDSSKRKTGESSS